MQISEEHESEICERHDIVEQQEMVGCKIFQIVVNIVENW